MIPEYVYAPSTGWHLLPAKAHRFRHRIEEVNDLLFEASYRILASSGEGRCQVGTFRVWQSEEPPDDWPHFAIEIEQLHDESVVWIETLPALWDFLRLYGGIGFQMARCLPGDHDNEDELMCVECEQRLQTDDGESVWECPHGVHESDDV